MRVNKQIANGIVAKQPDIVFFLSTILHRTDCNFMQREMPEHPEKQRRNKEQEQGREALKNKVKRMASPRNSNLGHIGERRMLSTTITPVSNSIFIFRS